MQPFLIQAVTYFSKFNFQEDTSVAKRFNFLVYQALCGVGGWKGGAGGGGGAEKRLAGTAVEANSPKKGRSLGTESKVEK